ncbi:bifunctional protein FolD 1, mitochondrial [Hordeum vulgare]|uniref:uncharacterized protein LOC123396785 n=1 Tax=Hordeum vulgare subsp. vulgare TaxID=112509 RepID=UPI00162B97C2|nr:uncharacterized protein LOC123396785 [Hordeum vulgare subsp. vulgare]KAE8815166.1 bifunctional protein FolD 1, mitochondrial [Hordeum vulgare]
MSWSCESGDGLTEDDDFNLGKQNMGSEAVGAGASRQHKDLDSAEAPTSSTCSSLSLALSTSIQPYRSAYSTYHAHHKDRLVMEGCDEIGIKSLLSELPGNCKEDGMMDSVPRFNEYPYVHGLLVQLPLPQTMHFTFLDAALERNYVSTFFMSMFCCFRQCVSRLIERGRGVLMLEPPQLKRTRRCSMTPLPECTDVQTPNHRRIFANPTKWWVYIQHEVSQADRAFFSMVVT